MSQNTAQGVMKTHEIIGIISDFNFQSLKNPLVIIPGKDLSRVMIRLTPDHMRKKLP